MTLNTDPGAQKIYKLSEKLKFLRRPLPTRAWTFFKSVRSGGTLLILAGVSLNPLPALALPVSIGWQVPLTGTHSYQLEVASDPGFSATALSAAVTGRSYNWEAPKEGVYHWRLLRLGKTAREQESSTFVSGSFIAVDPAITRTRPARVSWDRVEGADRYKLYVVNKAGKATTMLAESTSFVLSRTDTTIMIELVPYSGGRKTFRDYHFNPSLSWDSGVDAKPAAAEPVAAVPAVVPSEARVEGVAVAVPESESAVTEEPVPAVTEEPVTAPEVSAVEEVKPAAARRRKYQLSFFLYHGQEKLRLQKLEVFTSSLERVTGGGASLWVNPVSGLVVSGSGWYHEHKSKVGQKSLFGSEKIAIDQSRYLLDLAMGWNLLHWTSLDNQMLTLSFVAAAAQLPFMPLEFDASSGTPPSLTKKQISMNGAALGYSWLTELLGITLSGGLLSEASDSVEMGYQQLVFDYFQNENLAISVGFYNRFIQSSRCHASATTCLKEGKATTTSEERGVYLGLGASFF